MINYNEALEHEYAMYRKMFPDRTDIHTLAANKVRSKQTELGNEANLKGKKYIQKWNDGVRTNALNPDYIKKLDQLHAASKTAPHYGLQADQLTFLDKVQQYNRGRCTTNEIENKFVKIYDLIDLKGRKCLVYELMHETLNDMLSRMKREKVTDKHFQSGLLKQESAVDILKQLVDSLRCLHGARMYHSDLSINNILVSNVGELKLKISDYNCVFTDENQKLRGLSEEKIENIRNQYCGSSLEAVLLISDIVRRGENEILKELYPGEGETQQAAQTQQQQQQGGRPRKVRVTAKSDVWSIGALLYDFIMSDLPLHYDVRSVADSIARVYPKRENGKPILDLDLDPEFNRIFYPNNESTVRFTKNVQEFLTATMQLDPKKRPSLGDLTKFKLFTERYSVEQTPQERIGRKKQQAAKEKLQQQRLAAERESDRIELEREKRQIAQQQARKKRQQQQAERKRKQRQQTERVAKLGRPPIHPRTKPTRIYRVDNT